MKLYFRKIGEGKPLVMLHGVFGSSDNLFTVSKAIAEQGFTVYTLDARNHGQSPRSETFDYNAMAADLDEFLTDNNIENPVILGHSMGGKTVMQYAMNYDNFEKLIIVDIAPKFYPTHHNHIIEGLKAIDLTKVKSRNDATAIFKDYVADFGEQQFLLKNLYRTDEGGFDWRINIPVISKSINQVGEELVNTRTVEKPALFMRGGDSPYIQDEDIPAIKTIFPNAEIQTIAGANHWVHATKPEKFVESVFEFTTR
jgi:pimeloyl-ACP methyl ester carboxylesterase